MVTSRIKNQTDFGLALSTGLRQRANKPNISQYKPHAKQLQFHQSTKKGRLFTGGNRSGKTVGGGTEGVMLCMGNHPFETRFQPPFYLRAVGVNFEHGVEKIIKPEIERWLPPTQLLGDSWEKAYSKELRTLYLKNGSFIEFMSYEQDTDKFAGTSRHGIWFDEEPPKDVFDECLMRLIDTGGRWWMTMTPVEGITWVYDTIYMPAKEGKIIELDLPTGKQHINASDLYDIIEVDTTENPNINPMEMSLLTASLSEEDKKARREGLFISTGGFVYASSFVPSKHVIPNIVPDKNLLWVAALDHGYTNPTCWLWAAIDGEGRIFVFEEHYETRKIVSQHALDVHAVNTRYERAPDYYVGDPSIRNKDPITGTSVHIEYADNGIPILLGNNDQKAGIDKIIKLFSEDKLFISERCVNLISELKRLRWATYTSKKMSMDKNKKEEQHKKDDHAADALRYLVASRPQYDTGTEAPIDIRGLAPHSEGVSDSLVDRRVSTPNTQADYHMGSEW